MTLQFKKLPPEKQRSSSAVEMGGKGGGKKASKEQTTTPKKGKNREISGVSKTGGETPHPIVNRPQLSGY